MDAKILIVDDSEDRHKLKSVLCGAGYTVITACSWKDALSKKNAEKPDLTLIDLAILTENGNTKTAAYEVRKWMLEDKDRLLFIVPRKPSVKDVLSFSVIFIAPMDKLQKPYIAEEVIETVKQTLVFLAAKPGSVR